MATTTQNLGLIKPAGTDKIRIAQINSNMDTLDAKIGAVGSTSLQAQINNKDSAPTSGSTNPVTSGGVYTTVGNLAAGAAILANNNTHAAIASGQYVYVRGHGSLSEGLYQATAAIATNGTLSTSNLTAVSGGGLNAVKASVDSLNSKTTLVFTPVSDVDKTNLIITKVNRIVVITGYVTITNLTAGTYNLGKISSNVPLYPVRFLSSVASHPYDHPVDVAYGVIGNDGNVNINSTATGSRTATINACYIV